MREERLAVGGAIITAFVASLCCLGPLFFIALGLGAFGAAAAFETARPYLLGLALLLLALGFYRVYFRRTEAGGAGEARATNPVIKASRFGPSLPPTSLSASPPSPSYCCYIPTH